MIAARLHLAADAGVLASGADASAVLVGVPAGLDLSGFGGAALSIVQDRMPDAARWREAGLPVSSAVPDAPCDVAVVSIPRAKDAARARIAEAMAIARSHVVIDGQKTDGIEALLKDIRRRTPVLGTLSKAHGKLLWCAPSDAFAEWRARPGLVAGRWHTLPGVFSAGQVDPGSALLAAALPVQMSGRVADLGAGWGFLSAELLARCPGVVQVHLVEAQGAALECARRNVTDPRAVFHWADVTSWDAQGGLDAVVMNPPFHSGRAAEPDLGRAFIARAAQLLKPGGRLFMVANRHLPYEASLREQFVDVAEFGGTSKFKLLGAKLPSRAKR